jgi:predicted transcriptional regulator
MEIVEQKTFVKSEDSLILTIADPKTLQRVAKAISSDTRQRILVLLNIKSLDVSNIARELGQTEANISAQIQILQKAGLVSSEYKPGGHGVRKICFVNYRKIEISLD